MKVNAYNATGHAADISTGQTIPSGEAAKLDDKDPHDAALLDDGAFIAVPPKRPAKAANTTGSAGTTDTTEDNAS